VEYPGSIATPFTINGDIIKGAIPKHPGARRIRLRLHHDWTDIIVKDNAILTLVFTKDGALFDIEDFHFTSIGK
jgi:hypothetical protein